MKVKSLFFVILFTASSLFAQSIEFSGEFSGEQGEYEKSYLKKYSTFIANHTDSLKDCLIVKDDENDPDPIQCVHFPPSSIKKSSFVFHRDLSLIGTTSSPYSGTMWIPLTTDFKGNTKKFIGAIINTMYALNLITQKFIDPNAPLRKHLGY